MLLTSGSVTPKLELAFVLTQEGIILKPTERGYVLLKNGTRDFQNRAPFERSACFYMTITGNFDRFQCFNIETNFLKNENFFKKLDYLILVESTKIESATFAF